MTRNPEDLGELAFTMRRSGNMQPATQGLWRGNGGTPTLIASAPSGRTSISKPGR